MITRIIIFLLLIVAGIIVYRLADPLGAQDLLSKIQHLSFSNNKNDSYTTTVLDGSGTTIISKTGATSKTGSIASSRAINSGSVLSPLPFLLSQAWTIAQDIMTNSGSIATSGSSTTGSDSENDNILDAINSLINPAMTGNTTSTNSGNTQTGNLSTGTINTGTKIPTTPKPTPSNPSTTTTTTKPKTTTPSSSLSQKDRNDAHYFLQFMDIE